MTRNNHNPKNPKEETSMKTTEHCSVCGGVCLTSWQIMCRCCAACMDHQAHWKDA